MKLKPFTVQQKHYIARGNVLTEQLSEKVTHALGVTKQRVNPKRHHYIVSDPGAGKTYTVQKIADLYKIPLVKIQGAASMNAIIVYLATIAYTRTDKKLFIWIDDCDYIFMDNSSLSVMKGAIDEDRNILVWNKNMATQILIYENSSNESDKIKAEALRSYQPPGSVGVEIPTDNMTFIITSNRFLTKPNSDLDTHRKMNEAAIRDRVIYTHYNLSAGESWGWVASILLSTRKILGLNK